MGYGFKYEVMGGSKASKQFLSERSSSQEIGNRSEQSKNFSSDWELMLELRYKASSILI